MNNSMPSRRRFIGICAATAGLCWTPTRPRADARFEWRGTALGADARIVVEGLDRNAAQGAVNAARAEVERLEACFSLYRPDSELCRLNRDGMLAGPSHDFRLLLERSLEIWEKSSGAFNPAIQPIWNYLARHFSVGREPGVPSSNMLHQLVKRCNPAHISIAANRIGLSPGMALTFNGIAQGYITDSVAALLASHGLSDTLIDLGELTALPGRSWHVHVSGAKQRFLLNQRSLARSAGSGTPFTEDGRWHHLIAPDTGRSVNNFTQVTVAAPRAADADALSTALFVAPPTTHAEIMSRFPHAVIVAAG